MKLRKIEIITLVLLVTTIASAFVIDYVDRNKRHKDEVCYKKVYHINETITKYPVLKI